MHATAIRSKASTSWKTLKHWEAVLKDHCEFAVFAEYKNLDEDAQKKLLQALEGAVLMQLANILAQLQLRNGKASSKNSRKSKAESSSEVSSLVTAVRAAADNPRVADTLTPDAFDILRDFLSSWGAPVGAEELLYRHNLHEVRIRQEVLSQLSQCASSDQSVTKRSCDSSWEHLQAVSIASLQLFRSMTKMRLECKVVGSPHHTVGLTMVVEDALGDRAHCGVYNLPGVYNQQTADKAIPLNSTLIIAEPFMKIMADGTRGIRVDNPDEIQIFLPGQRLLPRLDARISARHSAFAGGLSEEPEHGVRAPVDVHDLLGDFQSGATVELHGLTSKRGGQLNGKVGVVADEQDPKDVERISVELASTTGRVEDVEVVKIRPSNLRHVAENSLQDILPAKAQANEAFARRDYLAAIEGYGEVIRKLSLIKTHEAASEKVKCLCNRSLCFSKLERWDEAREDSLAAVEREPANGKARFRLAFAIFRAGTVENQTKVSDAIKHVCIAAALNKVHADQSITDLLGEIASMSEKPVPPPGGVVAVRSSQQLAQALCSAATKFICLTPGDYACLPWPPAFRVEHDVTMVGLGNVTCLKSASHVFDIRARLHMSNIRLTDGQTNVQGEGFAACVVSGTASWLTLVSCTVENSCAGGVLVCESGRCTIDSCKFHNLSRQAIEVRELGQLEARHTQFQRVRQGVSAYAGARSVRLEHVLIDRTQNEGVLASGDLKTPETKILEQNLDVTHLQQASNPRGTPGWKQRAEAHQAGRWISMMSAEMAEELDWNGRLVFLMSDSTIRNAGGLACSLDEGCAAQVIRCTVEKTSKNFSAGFAGIGMMIKGGSDATVKQCRFLENVVGLNVGFNYAGNVVVENCVFAKNAFRDLVEDGNTDPLQLIREKLRKGASSADAAKLESYVETHRQAGVWSTPAKQVGLRFLSKKDRIPEISEISAVGVGPTSKQPLPQKLAWEAASENRYDLATPCPCGFCSTELGNSAECGQVGLLNHIDFPPFMCLPARPALAEKLDDPNAQFYFRSDASAPFRHWCLMGEILSVAIARGADAHSFMAAAGEDAAKSIQIRTRFADQSSPESDVEVLIMLDEPLVQGSSPLKPGCTLAVLYPEASEIDITRGTGQVVVTDSRRIYAFAGPLSEVLKLSENCLADENSGTELQSAQYPQLGRQTAMLRQLSSSDFRSFDSHLSFATWAKQAADEESQRSAAAEAMAEAPVKELPTETEAPQVDEPIVATADDLCARLDACESSELATVIQAVEEALQELKDDGSFVISKSGGRVKVQNKLKRIKARVAKAEEASAEVAKTAEVSDPQVPSPDQHAGIEEEAEVRVFGQGRREAGSGPLDADGYHGAVQLSQDPDAPRYLKDMCRRASHVFVSFPSPASNRHVPWCIDTAPLRYCSDFFEVASNPQRVRCLSCWGHDHSKSGHEIPSTSSKRLWKIRPRDVSFSQDSIGKAFKDGNTLDGTMAKIRSGECKIEDIEKIQITWHSHVRTSPGKPRWWSFTGNRRLSLYRKLEEEGALEFIVAEWVNSTVPDWRMTTRNADERPVVRQKSRR